MSTGQRQQTPTDVVAVPVDGWQPNEDAGTMQVVFITYDKRTR